MRTYFPKQVIIDTQEAVMKFKEQAAGHNYLPLLNHLQQSLVACVRDKKMAEYEINEFVAHLEFLEPPFDEWFVDFPPNEIIYSVHQLGMHIYKKILEADLYDEQGDFHYDWDPISDSDAFHDIVLTRDDVSIIRR
jgi:hypothetical protein